MGHAANTLSHTTAFAEAFERHRPEQSVLYQTLATHWDAFIERAEQAGGLPKFVLREVKEYLDCGILERGCALLACADCGLPRLVAFSCKRRGFCPSCCGRRMNDAALHLVERVIPQVPVRQWVCSLPWQLRYLLGCDRVLCAAVLQAFVQELSRSYQTRAKRQLGLCSVSLAHTGAVTFVQRFDSALRLNVHAHTIALDGVYLRAQDSQELRFVALPEPTQQEVTDLARRVANRIQKVLNKSGRWLDDEQGAHSADPLAEKEPVLSSCYQAAAQGKELLGERAGQPTLRLVSPPPERTTARSTGLVAEVRGVNIHAQTAIDGRDRKRLERLCRYIARPPIAQDRLEQMPDGRLRYTMKKTWSDGTHALVFEPLDLIARVVALIPPPRFHMLRFAGVLSANASLRKHVVPASAQRPEPQPPQLALFAPVPAWLPIVEPPQGSSARRPARHPWPLLMQHVFAKDVLACPRCKGRLRVLEVATSAQAIARVLASVGLGPRAPPRPPSVCTQQLALLLG
jgi:hypothetical protein